MARLVCSGRVRGAFRVLTWGHYVFSRIFLRNNFLVEVMNRYSKHSKLVIPTHVPASPIATQRPAAKPPHRLDRKVSAETAAQLVADYESGVPSTHLTRIYGLGKGSILKLLKEAGVQMRHQGLSSDNLEEAAALYREGWSLPRVAERFGCSVGSIRKEFRNHGVQIRSPNGWA